jgi:hypothetical protein
MLQRQTFTFFLINWTLRLDGILPVLGTFYRFTFEMQYSKDKTLLSFSVVNWQLGPDGIHFVLGKF